MWSQFESLGMNAQGHLEYRHRQTEIVFVWVPGGTFLMGSTEKELRQVANDRKRKNPRIRKNEWLKDWVAREAPKHKVTLSPFLIAKYEVTQRQWKEVMESNPSYYPRGGGSEALDYPVETVTWHECLEFCRKAGLNLPTEAQWEYACRAETETQFGGTGRLDDMGWHLDHGGRRTHVGGLKTPNDFGIHDMHGNVSEWCLDMYDEEFYRRAEASLLNPLCLDGSEVRVHRGGSADWVGFQHRSAFRNRAPVTGSRVAQSEPGSIGLRPVFNLAP